MCVNVFNSRFYQINSSTEPGIQERTELVEVASGPSPDLYGRTAAY